MRAEPTNRVVASGQSVGKSLVSLALGLNDNRDYDSSADGITDSQFPGETRDI